MDFIEGERLSIILYNIVESNLPELCNKLAKCFHKLHKLDPKKINLLIPYEDNETNFDFIVLKELEIPLDLASKYNLKSIHLLIKWTNTTMKTISKVPLSLIHGDLNPLNVIICEKNIFLIAISNIKVSDYRIDLAMAYCTMNIECPYDTKDLLVTSYEKISGQKIENLDFFVILSNIKIVCLMIAGLLDQSNVKLDIGRKIFEFKPYVNYITKIFEQITGILIPELHDTR